MTTLSKRLFRESALERLSSPEQLDQLLRVTSPRGWVSLVALWALLATIVAWSILGRVPTNEEGQGILVAGGGLKVVVAPGSGRLTSIDVEVGVTVEKDQVVAAIDKQEIADELAETSSQLDELKRQRQSHAEFDEREEQLRESLAAVETQRLRQTIEFSQERSERLHAKRVVVQDLIAEGMMTENDLHKVDEDLEDTLIAGEKARLEIEQLVARDREASFQRERERMGRDLKVEELQGKVSMLRSRLNRESRVTSPFAGRVVEIRAAVQTTVNTGDSILLVEPAGAAHLEAILYVPASTGKRIKQGMQVHVSPSTVKREEHGSMLGKVLFIADVPTSTSAMLAVLANKDLVEQFTREIPVPLQMRVSLETSRDTMSGFKWTSSQGPQTRVSAGTPCHGSVTVEEQRPIELVIPFLRKKLGAD